MKNQWMELKICLSPEGYRSLKKLAEQSSKSVSELINCLIADYIERNANDECAKLS